MRNNNSQKRGWDICGTVLPHPHLPYTYNVAPECSLPYTKELHPNETVLLILIISANCIQMEDQNVHVQHSSELRNTKQKIL
jgi:hypothetical protein